MDAGPYSNVLEDWVQKSRSSLSRSKPVVYQQPLYYLFSCLSSEFSHLAYLPFDNGELLGPLRQGLMRFMTLSGQQIITTESARLLICDHMESEAPLQFFRGWSSIFEVSNEVVQGFSPLPGFDAVFKDFVVVVFKEGGVSMDKVCGVGTNLVDKVEDIIDPFVFVHR